MKQDLWDIFFISFRESNCEENWCRLISLHPSAKRLHGIQGIDRAHNAANSLATTEFFWVVDGDNYIIDPLIYNNIPEVDLLMFNTLDPLTNDSTSLGAVKLWRKDSFINKDMSQGDFTLFSVKTKKVLPNILSVSNYNSTPFEAWKTSFRHCVKLLSVILSTRKHATNREKFIENWQSTQNSTGLNANWAYKGYLDARDYVKLYDNNLQQLNKINDYDWLEQYFKNVN